MAGFGVAFVGLAALLSAEEPGSTVDYREEKNWAALPGRVDSADAVPANSGLEDRQSDAAADVFFIHPTTFYSMWHLNAGIDDQRLNDFTDRTTIKTQASVFNGSCRVYAPRYRQASLFAFVNKKNKKKALDLAYRDVKHAFIHYLEHYSGGRPFIIASHSQGTFHAVRLLQELVDADENLRKRLVAAYLVGGPATDGSFLTIPAADSAAQTGCYLTWNTMLAGGAPLYRNCRPTNPLTWKRDTSYAGPELNRGGVPRSFDRIDRCLVGARCASSGALWIDKPREKGYLGTKNYHLCDYSMFYMNIRENVRERIAAWQGGRAH